MNQSARGQRRANQGTESGTRQALLEAARACVRDHGVAKTTSRRIAATAQANLGAITYYFGSKEELVAEALFGELERRLAPVIEMLGDRSVAAPTRLLTGLRKLVGEFEQSRAEVPVYLSALVQSTAAGPLTERSSAMLADLNTALGAVIAQLKVDGVIADWVEPEAMASLLIATGNGIALQSQLDPTGPPVTDLATQLAALLLAASTQRARDAQPQIADPQLQAVSAST